LNNPEENVYDAIRAGYRRLDSACDYGNEEATGRGIARAIAEGIVKREDLYITTKLWNTYHDPKHVRRALERCLKDLGLDYVDEFLIHFPISMEVRVICINRAYFLLLGLLPDQPKLS
jgi:diketogulonate reductase-like aldo/keto reductase